jgi:hypothetical protein
MLHYRVVSLNLIFETNIIIIHGALYSIVPAKNIKSDRSSDDCEGYKVGNTKKMCNNIYLLN